MARLSRLSLPSIPQHIIQRGSNRQACFYADEDYRFYPDASVKPLENTEFQYTPTC